MLINRAVLSSFAALGVVAGALALTAARRDERVERVDFDKVVRATSPVYDARLAPVVDARIKEFRIPIKDATLEIAKGITYQGWTFGGTVPGPVIHVRVGDLVRVTVVNNSPMPLDRLSRAPDPGQHRVSHDQGIRPTNE
jgi:FtsP/CotA-like multicopper oxidase with cupredoxin domain